MDTQTQTHTHKHTHTHTHTHTHAHTRIHTHKNLRGNRRKHISRGKEMRARINATTKLGSDICKPVLRRACARAFCVSFACLLHAFCLIFFLIPAYLRVTNATLHK